MKTTPTAAWLDAQALRDKIHANREKILADDLSSVVYLYNHPAGKPCAIGYRGRAKKPAFNYYYSSTENRAEHVKNWMQTQSQRKNTPRTIAPRALEVEDVLCASWGYDQTNIDYYKVIRLVGKRSVELVEIGQDKTHEGYMNGGCTPDPDTVVGEPFIKRTCIHCGESVNIDSVRRARKKNYELINDQRVYRIDRWSAYA